MGRSPNNGACFRRRRFFGAQKYTDATSLPRRLNSTGIEVPALGSWLTFDPYTRAYLKIWYTGTVYPKSTFHHHISDSNCHKSGYNSHFEFPIPTQIGRLNMVYFPSRNPVNHSISPFLDYPVTIKPQHPHPTPHPGSTFNSNQKPSRAARPGTNIAMGIINQSLDWGACPHPTRRPSLLGSRSPPGVEAVDWAGEFSDVSCAGFGKPGVRGCVPKR